MEEDPNLQSSTAVEEDFELQFSAAMEEDSKPQFSTTMEGVAAFLPTPQPSTANHEEQIDQVIEDEGAEQNGGERPAKKQKLSNGFEGQQQQQSRNKKNKNKKGNANANVEPARGLAPKDPLNHLKKGLLYIISGADADNFSEEIRQHAQELQRLLFLRPAPTEAEPATEAESPAAPASPPLSSDVPEPVQAKVEAVAVNPHTELPPPFALPDPKTFMKGPSPALAALNRIHPCTSNYAPLPIKINHDTTTNVPVPDSTTLPALPPITDLVLFNAPFTHTSALAAYIPPTNTNSYEPLEFLGDAYLEVIATRLIHSRFPLHNVGQKAGLRELIVKNETLASYAKAYGFDTRVRTSESVKQTAGPAWTKVLADVFEAYVACIIIQTPHEKGFVTAEQWLTDLWAPKILEWKAKGDGVRSATQVGQEKAMDAKSDLNRLVVGKESKVEYREERPMEMIMPGNRQNFFMGVYLTGLGFTDQQLGVGEGRSKQIAGMAAAMDALKNSQDIIAVANRRKMELERNVKKKMGDNKRKHQHQVNQATNSHAVNPHRGYRG